MRTISFEKAFLETNGKLSLYSLSLSFKKGHVFVGDGLSELVGQRVEHGVVRVHRGQPVPLQLVSHDREFLNNVVSSTIVFENETNQLKTVKVSSKDI